MKYETKYYGWWTKLLNLLQGSKPGPLTYRASVLTIKPSKLEVLGSTPGVGFI